MVKLMSMSFRFSFSGRVEGLECDKARLTELANPGFLIAVD